MNFALRKATNILDVVFGPEKMSIYVSAGFSRDGFMWIESSLLRKTDCVHSHHSNFKRISAVCRHGICTTDYSSSPCVSVVCETDEVLAPSCRSSCISFSSSLIWLIHVAFGLSMGRLTGLRAYSMALRVGVNLGSLIRCPSHFRRRILILLLQGS